MMFATVVKYTLPFLAYNRHASFKFEKFAIIFFIITFDHYFILSTRLIPKSKENENKPNQVDYVLQPSMGHLCVPRTGMDGPQVILS